MQATGLSKVSVGREECVRKEEEKRREEKRRGIQNERQRLVDANIKKGRDSAVKV